MTSQPDYFINLPSEVVLTIYEAQDSFKDIRSLFSTCKPLHNLWQSRAHSLSSKLLAHQTPCYKEASLLATAEQTLHPVSNSQDLNLQQKYQTTLHRISSTRRSTKQATYLCEMIQTRFLAQKQHCHDAVCRTHPSVLLPQERNAIILSHHFIKLFTLSHSSPHLSETFSHCKTKLKDMSAQEKRVIKETVNVMWDYAMPWDKLKLGICVPVMGMEAFEFGDGGGKDWREGFDGLKREMGAEEEGERGCGRCVWDGLGRFGREVQGGDGVRWVAGG